MGGQWTYQLADQLNQIAAGLGSIVPELLVVLGFLLALVGEFSLGKKWKGLVPGISAAALLASAVLGAVMLWQRDTPEVRELSGNWFLGMVEVDDLGRYLAVLVDLVALVTVGISVRSRQLRNQARGLGEYFVVLMAMVVGMHFMGMASNLMMVYLAVEMVSLPAYVLTAYARLNGKSAEAALKYVIYGSFSSGIMLYGISWLYGMGGTLNPLDPAFAAGLAAQDPWVVFFVVGLVLAGLVFKISILPFHFWAPDVYEGASYPVAAFFSVAPKAAGFVLLMRFWMAMPVEGPARQWLSWLLIAAAVGSMFLGNLVALRQGHFRRMLAWSSVAQAGYILVGLVSGSVLGYGAVLFYLTVYAAMNFGAFLVAGWLDEEMGLEKIDDLKGLAQGLPVLAVVLTIFMIALTGLPPTAGFIAKLEVFLAALDSYQALGDHAYMVAMVAILLNTVISLFYYLRAPSRMVFQNSPIKSYPRFRGLIPLVVVILAIPMVWWGLFHFDGLIAFFQSLLPDWDGQIRI